MDVRCTSTPAGEVAAEVLADRVKRVRRILPLAAWQYEEDVEYVHQLRTSCRRAAAALQAFRPLTESKPKRLGKLLRKIRTAAGPARDADVLLSRLEKESKGDPSADYVLARLRRQRTTAQKALKRVGKKTKSKQLRDALGCVRKALADGSREEQQMRFRNFGRIALAEASQGVFLLTAVSQPSISQLHQLRIAGKRLRYSIELFHQAFPKAMRTEVYPSIQKLQERLGKLNDHATAQAVFHSWLADMPVGPRAANLAERIVAEHQASEKLREDFLQWWTDQRVAMLEALLSELLQPAR